MASIEPPVVDSLEFRVLGPTTVLRAGVPIDLGGPQRRAVLTLLLVHANAVVPTDVIADLLWCDSPPRSSRVQIQGLVSDLRRRLAAGRSRAVAPIATRPSGYLLEVADGDLDLATFRAEVEKARAAGDAASTAWLLESALARWHGPAYGGFSFPAAGPAVAAVEEERWTAVEDLVDARLAAGRLAGLSAELVRRTGEHPLRERFHGQLMTVLARTSRVGEALAVYRDLRDRLVDELGVEPSAPIQRLHRQILLGASEPVDDGGPDQLARVSAYRQLPPDLADFIGRRAELDAILGLGRPTDGTGTASRIVVISGMAGVGKTRLALRAAHQLVAEGRYADGQLYVDLGGDLGGGLGGPVASGATLAHLLRLLGVPPDLVPPTIDARSAVLRDRLADRSVLMILDGAADERQVEPLLAAGSRALVIVTSRRALALDGALHVNLPMFTPAEAVSLLGAVAGAERVAAEPEAAGELVTRCGHLPLALAVAAHRLRTRPAWPVAQLVERLATQGRQLDELTVGGRAVEAVFQHAYDSLPERLRRVFRRLGLHPGVDTTGAPVAALADLDPRDADAALEELLDQHLLLQSVPGRYRMHDLIRAFAHRAGQRDDTSEASDAAVANLLDWYVEAVDAACRPLRRFRVGVTNRVPASKTPCPRFDTAEQAMAWLDAEFANLLGVIRLADSYRRHAHAVVLPHLLQPYFVRRAPLTEWIAVLRVAEAAARDAGELSELAHTMTEIGHAYGSAGEVDTGEARLRQAVELHELCGNGYGRAVALNHLGTSQRRLGRYPDAVAMYRAALGLFETHGDRVRVASTGSNLAVVLHLLGRDGEAISQAKQAVRVQQAIGGPGEAALRTNLGRIYARTQRHEEAVEQSVRALQLHRIDGSRSGEANTLSNLSGSYARLGRYADGVRAGRRAVEIARQIANPEIEAFAFNSLGEVYAQAGRHRTAVRRHRVALALVGELGEADERIRALAGIARALTAPI